MTYKEKWEQEHPDKIFKVGFVQCPSTHGYRPKESVNDCKPVTCTQCWNSDMTVEDSAYNAAKNMADAARQAGQNILDCLYVNADKIGGKSTDAPWLKKNLHIPEERGCIIGDEKVEHPDTDLPAEPIIKDSGDRTEFKTGAVRDMREGKGRCDLMPLEVVGRWMSDNILTNLGMFLRYRNSRDTSWLYQALSMFIAKRYPTNGTDNCNKANQSDMMLEVAKHFEEGAKKYGENNWQKGIPVNCYIDSAIRHYLKWLRGDKDEPHDRAFCWNLMCCIWEVDYSERAESKVK